MKHKRHNLEDLKLREFGGEWGVSIALIGEKKGREIVSFPAALHEAGREFFPGNLYSILRCRKHHA